MKIIIITFITLVTMVAIFSDANMTTEETSQDSVRTLIDNYNYRFLFIMKFLNQSIISTNYKSNL